jgi:hypothetical protein
VERNIRNVAIQSTDKSKLPHSYFIGLLTLQA